MKEEKTKNYSAPALDKGLDILELLVEKKNPMTLAQISLELGRSKSELYRMAAVLEARGYLSRHGDSDSFVVSNKLFDLGMSVPPVGTLVEAAFPLMHELAQKISQSCHLTVMSGNHGVIIARVENPTQISFSVRVGYRMDLHTSCSGIILLSWMEEKKREEIYKQYASSNDFNKEKLESLLSETRKNGYIKMSSVTTSGVLDLSSPIFIDDKHEATAALTVPYCKHRGINTPSPAACLEEISKCTKKLSSLAKTFGGF
ncbi:IclR family transcriptional regulator [Pseudoalteromonas phenolica]|uniref:Regulatory protein, IclR n=1 Tax=Pseudoalteromonas phenolica TaxID=161398 RepID=A0A0S2K461_9GAMM|nr:IclR family transcriptional regulator [Pseudoalteromonas phenolica]ALO42862.1 Regulatory protein, IclR [Pseudoalteromonas phenolica]MBE0356004.1 hypothetical protein [Pseudoalteromonas phenolica O-BC30]